MPPELLLRPAGPDDLPAVAEVHLAARAAAAMPPPVHPPDDVRRWVRSWDLGTTEVWVAEGSDGVLGYARLTDAWLDDLYVLPEHRGAVVGSALLDLAKALRPAGFGLWVFEQNAPARAFYARHGLLEVERTDGSGNEERAPDIRVEWRPPPGAGCPVGGVRHTDVR